MSWGSIRRLWLSLLIFWGCFAWLGFFALEPLIADTMVCLAAAICIPSWLHIWRDT